MPDYTDYYSTVKNGLLLRLRYSLKADFLIDKEDEKVSDNESNLFKGADYYVVLKPGPFPALDAATYKSGEVQTVDWTTRIELYVRYIERAEQWGRFDPFRSAVIWHVMKNRFLGNVTIAGTAIAEVPHVDRVRSIQAGADATYFRFFNTPPTMSPNYMFQPLICVVRQRVRFD